jgi:hypothetical protein
VEGSCEHGDEPSGSLKLLGSRKETTRKTKLKVVDSIKIER